MRTRHMSSIQALITAASADRALPIIKRTRILVTGAIAIGRVNGSLRFARVVHEQVVRGQSSRDADRVFESHDLHRKSSAVLLFFVSSIQREYPVHRRPVAKAYRARGKRPIARQVTAKNPAPYIRSSFSFTAGGK